MKTILVVKICVLSSISIFSQTVEYYDANWERTTKDQAAYYREINYDENRKPIGLIKGFHISGELQFEGQMISINPDILDGKCIWYYKNGQKSEEGIYRAGEIAEGPRNWSEDGKEEGALDDSGFFFSETYHRQFLNDLSEAFGEKFAIDSTVTVFLLNAGEANIKNGDFVTGTVICKVAHDFAKILNNENYKAQSFNSIGVLYTHSRNFKEALFWLNKAKEIRKTLGQKDALAESYLNLGTLYQAQKQYQEALDWIDRAKTILKKMAPGRVLAICYYSTGVIFKSLRKFDQAINEYNKAREILEGLGENLWLGIIYQNIGSINQSLANYEEALLWTKRGINIFEKHKNEALLAASYNNFGVAYQCQGKFDESLLYSNKAKSIAQRLGLEEELAFSYKNIGTVYTSQGHFEKALFYCNKAKEVFEELGMEEELAISYGNLGYIHQLQGNYDQSLDWFNKAKDIHERLDSKVYLARSYKDIGEIYYRKGNYDQSLIWYNQAKEIEEKFSLEEGLVRTYNNIGSIYLDKRNYERALSWFHKSREIIEKIGLELQRGITFSNIGSVYQYQKLYDKALPWFNKAREMAEKLNDKVRLSTVYNNIGTIYSGKGDYEMALFWYEKSMAIRKKLGLEVDLSKSYNNIGVVYSNIREMNTAIEWYQKAKKLRERLGLEVELARSYEDLSLSFYKSLKPDSALFYAQKNIDLNEILRQANKGEADRQLFVTKSIKAIEIGISSAHTLQKPTRAFILSEKGKARGLSDLLSEKKITSIKPPKSLNDPYVSVQNQLKAIQRILSSDIPAEKRKNLLHKRDTLYEMREEIEDQIRVFAPEFTDLVYPQTIDDSKLQSILHKDEVVVSYFVGQQTSYAWIITPFLIEMIDLDPTYSLETLVERFRNDFINLQKATTISSTPNRLKQAKLNQQFFQLSSQLYQKLWAPLDSSGLLKDKKIILVPDGFLNYLPFELLVKDTVNKDFQDYHYLIKDHPISYYPSATVLYFERTKARKEAKPIKDYFGLAVSNFDNALCTADGKALASLTNTTTSVELIKKYFSPEKSTTIFDEEANRDDFSSLDLKDYRYLNFATHGQINPEQPEFSNILLHDGCLNLYEIFELELNADLVTLSACETGLGKLVRGEGMVGFTRALMYAGTPSVILSLWEVGDDSTKELFVDYYRQLASDVREKHEPLRNVQLKMIEEGKYSNPYFWAPFVFIGERQSRF